jgi:ABC-type multidrug transport system ATPase subunit
MEEAARVSKIIAIIDGGKIVAQGTAEELKATTKTASLEDAFISLTGKKIREEEATSADRMRTQRRMFRR